MKLGDVIGFSGHDWQSHVINMATLGIPFWSISHVGIVGPAGDNKALYEATTSLPSHPCLLTGRVDGVKAVDLESRIDAYEGSVWRYPLARPLYSHECKRLSDLLKAVIGTSYDWRDAFRSNSVFRFVEQWPRPSCVRELFCSELVTYCLNQIGLFPTQNVSKWSPNALMRKLRKGVVKKAVRLK